MLKAVQWVGLRESSDAEKEHTNRVGKDMKHAGRSSTGMLRQDAHTKCFATKACTGRVMQRCDIH